MEGLTPPGSVRHGQDGSGCGCEIGRPALFQVLNEIPEDVVFSFRVALFLRIFAGVLPGGLPGSVAIRAALACEGQRFRCPLPFRCSR